MKWYKCFISGENFPGELISEEGLIGFFTTRYVEAISPEEAEQIALTYLRKEESLQLPAGVKPSEGAKVFFESIEEISKNEVPKIQGGFTFYVMGT